MSQLMLRVVPDSPVVFGNQGDAVVAVPLRSIPFYALYTPIEGGKATYEFACDTNGNTTKSGSVNMIVGKELRISDLSCTYSHEGNFTPNIKLANASGPVASAQVSLQISSTPPDAESQGSLMNITVSSSAHMYLVFGIVIAILAGLIYWGRGSLRK